MVMAICAQIDAASASEMVPELSMSCSAHTSCQCERIQSMAGLCFAMAPKFCRSASRNSWPSIISSPAACVYEIMPSSPSVPPICAFTFAIAAEMISSGSLARSVLHSESEEPYTALAASRSSRVASERAATSTSDSEPSSKKMTIRFLKSTTVARKYFEPSPTRRSSSTGSAIHSSPGSSACVGFFLGLPNMRRIIVAVRTTAMQRCWVSRRRPRCAEPAARGSDGVAEK